MVKNQRQTRFGRVRQPLLSGAFVLAASATVIAFQGGAPGQINPGLLKAGQQKVGDIQKLPDIRLDSKTLRVKKLDKLETEIPVLRKAEFQNLFGGNAKVPRTSQKVRELSKFLYSDAGRATLDECAEEEFGALTAALMNPDITDADRDAVDGDADASMPTLNRTYKSGHFRFQYTDNNSNSKHNSTLANIQATAAVMNAAWNDFTANFKKPKHYKKLISILPIRFEELIDVKCYDLGDSLFGVTNSNWNHIELNSNKVIKSTAKRQTTPVHELFHRVQYSYGYITGTPSMKWAVEATASWSQKYRAPAVGDWMSRINSGLNAPDADLTSRSYDLCGMWCYMGQRAGNERNFIRKAWSEYTLLNGFNMKTALTKSIKTYIGNAYTLDHIIGWWNFTNFYKDMSNASASFDYAEDENGAGGYGPLVSVPKTTKTLAKGGATATTAASAADYGADYHVYNLTGNPTKVELKITTTGKFGYAVIKYKGSTMVQTGYSRTPAGNNGSKTYLETINPATTDRVALVVIGNPTGGSYTINAKAF